MSNLKSIVFNSLLIFLILLIIGCSICESKGGRGGGGGGGGGGGRGGGSRGGGSRGGSRGGSKGGKGGSRGGSRGGSSPYTSSTFRQALIAGQIYGSVSYMRSSRYRSNPNKMPTICTNNFEKDSNGTTYGYFICPRDGEPENYTYCCGDEKNETCCEYSESDDDGGRIWTAFGYFFGIFGAVFLILCYLCSCACKKCKNNTNNNRSCCCVSNSTSKTNNSTVFPGPAYINHSTAFPVPAYTNGSTDTAYYKPPVHENPNYVQPSVPTGFGNFGTSYPSQQPPPYSSKTEKY